MPASQHLAHVLFRRVSTPRARLQTKRNETTANHLSIPSRGPQLLSMPTDSPSTPSQGRREVALGLVRLVRECTDFPIHKHAAHVIRKVDRHPVTGKWRAEGWKTGEQLRFRHQIRRVLGSRVDINRLFERLEPTRWRGDDIADAFWTFFLRNVHGADAFPDVVNVKQELLVKKTNNTSSSTSPRGTEPYALNDEFFHRRGLTRDDFVNALARCVARPDETFPSWLRLAGWDDVCEGDRDPSEYDLPPAPSRTISAPRVVARSAVQVPDTIIKKRKRGASLGPSASDASEATDATCGHVRGAELKKMQKMQSGRSRMTSTRAVTRTGRTQRFEPPTSVAEHLPRPNSSSPTSKRRWMMDTKRHGMMNTNRRRREPISWWPLRR